MPGKNPYRPGASVTPLYIAGREAQERRFKSVLRAAPEIPANVRVTGLRGVGKTVLLKRFEGIASTESMWAVQRVQLEPRHNREDVLVELLISLANRTTERLSRMERVKSTVSDMVVAGRSLFQITVQDLTFSLGGDVVGQRLELVDALLETTRTAVKKGRSGYVMLLDEAQVLVDETSRTGEHPLSLLIASINALQEAGVPVGLILCGLPTLKSNMLKARTYSERMFRGEDVDSLNADDAKEHSSARWTERASERIRTSSPIRSRRLRGTRSSSSSGERSCGMRPSSRVRRASTSVCSIPSGRRSSSDWIVTSTTRASSR